MKKIYLFCFLGLSCMASLSVQAKDYLVSTPHTSLLISAEKGKPLLFNYYGSHIDPAHIQDIYNSNLNLNSESYPAFGIQSDGEKAISVTQPDGNMSLDLAVDSVREYSDKEGKITEVTMNDKVYPFQVKQFYKAYNNSDIIGTWVTLSNNGKKPVTLYKFASAYLSFFRGNNWITQLHGVWAAENMPVEEPLNNGLHVIKNTDGVRNGQTDHPSVMISLDGKPSETAGHVIAGTLAWSGNYRMEVEATNDGINLLAGIDETNSHYQLAPKETFTTPEFDLTYSSDGKGTISRNYHRWAREYKLCHGNQPRDILLNSWEGVHFDVNQEGMDHMMRDMSAMGGELFVMDDGWFGDKYPRNDGSTSLGDWGVCTKKLPQGIEGLLASAKSHNIKFGLWIEPEMANTKSELFEKHPDWVLSQSNRPLSVGRGHTQVVLDLTNPKVQDFVFGVVDNLMTKYPTLSYIKWDANSGLMNYGSHYLPKDRQSEIYIRYHVGLNNVLKRIRAKYPDLVMQACASGGGRADYGVLPYFDEFWTSDNTDALQRIYMQWGISYFMPAIAMASHVSAYKNQETGRCLPLKFRFDVAMSGRLGMEIQPNDMSPQDKAFAKAAIADYKIIRPIVQFGDLYRLISPFDHKGVASLMYVSADKAKAVFFAYKTEHMYDQTIPVFCMNGLDPASNYRVTEIDNEGKSRLAINGKTVSGKILMEEGLRLPMYREFSSFALQLEKAN